MRHVVVDGLFTSAELAAANAAWPPPSWAGWVRYHGEQGSKLASDLVTPLPCCLSALLARLAVLPLGRLLGMSDAVADLSLQGGGLHEMGHGQALPSHLDHDTHPRLGLARVYSAVLYVHQSWDPSWSGELVLEGAPCSAVSPRPGRLVVFDASVRHRVEPVGCPERFARRSLALFGYKPEPGAMLRPRAAFGAAEPAPR